MTTQATAGRASPMSEPSTTRLLFADTRMAPVWLVLRVYLGVPGYPGTVFGRRGGGETSRRVI